MRIGRAVVTAGTVAAAAIAVHTAANLRLLRTPSAAAPPTEEKVSVLIPARDEEDHIGATLRSVLAQEGVEHLAVIVLDDGSRDATATIVAQLAAGDARLQLVHGGDDDLPAGWLGKPWACARLSSHADGSVLVFVDADVTLDPHAIRSLVAMLRECDLVMVAPYPRQLAESWLERLVQPLLTWSWIATMPVRWAEGSQRPSLSAANGQLLAIDARAYHAIGGHLSVQDEVIEDVALMRAVKLAGGRAATVDGSELAECRMYDSPAALVDGYAKSLWSAFNGPAGTIAVNALLVGAFVVPAVAAVAAPTSRTRIIGLLGYGAGIAGRTMAARRTDDRVLPDVLAHPASILAFTALNVVSWNRHARGTNTWKGRTV